MTEIQRILKENALRNKNLVKQYNPETGKGCVGRRRKIILRGKTYHLPIEMVNEEGFDKAAEQANATEGKRIVSNKAWMEIEKRRCRHDFEFWAWRCAKIKHKTSGERVPFILNQPQRRILGLLEEDRKAGRPIRMIMLKARQWGGSTLIQMYFAWIQLVLATGKNLLICAHVKNSAAVIREMYSQILKEYPAALWGAKKASRKNATEGSHPS